MQRIRYSVERLDGPQAVLSRTRLGVGRVVLGRSVDCELCIDVRGVSRQHVECEVLESGGLVLRDLGSTNGSRVNGRPLVAAAISGDFDLDLGAVRLRFREHAGDLDVLAYATALKQAPAAQPEPAAAGTVLMTLLNQCRELAWQLISAAPADEPWPSLASRIGAAALEPLGLQGLRLRGPGGSVLAQASRVDDIDWQPLVRSDDYALEVDGASRERLRPLVPALQGLIAWLPLADPPASTGQQQAPAPPGLPSANPSMRRLLEGLARAARGKVGVLILGETGVGKELIARWVHECSPRAGHPFVAINCAALPRDLLEAELFGVEKGAATGVDARPGLFERAHGGTLFLDELGDMPAETQVRLLRALEDGRIVRVGGQRAIETDVRLLAATHQDLQQAIADKRFRLDLFHRIAAVTVQIPPLRERIEDIAPLAIHFFQRALEEGGIRSPGISAEALVALQRWSWPGNVRELRQAVEAGVVMLAPGEALTATHLPPALRNAQPEPVSMDLGSALARAEHAALVAALAASGGDHRRAWTMLGIGKTSFYRKLREHGLSRGERDDEAGDD